MIGRETSPRTALLIVMPMMGGVFSSAKGGMIAAVGSPIGHLLYGSLLGAIAGGAEATVAHA